MMLFQAKLTKTDCIVMTLNFYIMSLIKYLILKQTLKYQKPGLVKSSRKMFFQVLKFCSRFLKLHNIGNVCCLKIN